MKAFRRFVVKVYDEHDNFLGIEEIGDNTYIVPELKRLIPIVKKYNGNACSLFELKELKSGKIYNLKSNEERDKKYLAMERRYLENEIRDGLIFEDWVRLNETSAEDLLGMNSESSTKRGVLKSLAVKYGLSSTRISQIVSREKRRFYAHNYMFRNK